MKQARIEVRVRNNVLWHAIFDRWRSVSEFCRENHFCQIAVGEYLNLKNSPRTNARDATEANWKPTAARLAEVLGILPDELFPESLYRMTRTRAVFEYDPIGLPIGREALQIAAPGATEDLAESNSTRRVIEKALSGIAPMERVVLVRRFGLFGYPEQSLDEIGAALRLTGERIRQIEAKALRKLRRSDYGAELGFLAEG